MGFNLRPEDVGLIAAALRLGDWLADYAHTTAAQVQTIREVQAVLRRLPDDSPEVVDAEYGFRVRTGDDEAGLSRGWTVSLWRPGAGEPGIIEIFNTYTTPAHDAVEESSHESCLELHANDSWNPYTGDWHEWIEEVRDPRVWMVEGAEIEVTAEIRC